MHVKDQEDLIASLPELWFPGQTWSIRIGSGGMNNTTRFVEVDGTSYVLRVYETHRDMDKAMQDFRHFPRGHRLIWPTPIFVACASHIP